MSNFVIVNSMFNLQIDRDNQSKWFLVLDKNGDEYLTPITEKELSSINDGGLWRISVQKTKRHSITNLSVSSYSIVAVYDYLTLDFIRNNYQVIIHNNKYKILVTETD